MLQIEEAPSSPIRAIHTPLTKLLDIKVPVLLAPMSTGGGGALAAQVTKYGGFAFIPAGTSKLQIHSSSLMTWAFMTDHGAGDDTVENLKKEIQTFKDVIKPSPLTQVPVGIGFLAWYLDAGHKDLLVAALDLEVKAIFFAFGDHMDRWINFIRSCDQVSCLSLSLTRTPGIFSVPCDRPAGVKPSSLSWSTPASKLLPLLSWGPTLWSPKVGDSS
jgi:NAD(P)H-dependent flavin oxidoreductase YrpB (nitropropane dioxygenase family)